GRQRGRTSQQPRARLPRMETRASRRRAADRLVAEPIQPDHRPAHRSLGPGMAAEGVGTYLSPMARADVLAPANALDERGASACKRGGTVVRHGRPSRDFRPLGTNAATTPAACDSGLRRGPTRSGRALLAPDHRAALGVASGQNNRSFVLI